MRVTSSVLFYLLEREYPVSCPPGNGADLELAGIRLFNGDQPEAGILYIVGDPKAMGAIESADSCAFLFVGPAAEAAPPQGIASAALIRGPFSPGRILESAFSLFIRLQDWDFRLRDAFLEEAGYAKLFRIAKELFTLPFSLVDRNFTIIATSTDTSIAPADALDKVPIDIVNRLLMDGGEYYRTLRYREPYLYPTYPSPERFLCYNIFMGSRFEGRVVASCDQDTPTMAGLFQLFSHFCAYVGKLFVNTTEDLIAKKQGDSLHEFVRGSILGSKDESEKNIAAILGEAKWKAGSAYSVMVFQIPDEREFEHGSPYICRHLETDVLQSCAIAHESHIVWLINNADPKKNARSWERFLQLANHIVREFHCQAGISNSSTDFLELRNCYLQALAALQLGRKKSPESLVYHFSDHVLDYLIDRSKGELSDTSLLHPGYAMLRDLDARHGTDYVKTIQRFIEAQYHTNRAAESLFIHKTTLIRRLEKIRDLAGIDFGSPDELLHLAISLRLH